MHDWIASCVSSELSCSQLPSRNYLKPCPHYLVPAGKYPLGCTAFRNISPNIELEESGIKEDKEQSEEQTYTEVCVGVKVFGCEGVGERRQEGRTRM